MWIDLRGRPSTRLDHLPRTRVRGLEVPVARGWRARLLGLAFLERERAGAGLLIPGCRSVHTFGMRFRLDIVFLDRKGEVRSVRRTVGPGHFVRDRRASAVLELPSNAA